MNAINKTGVSLAWKPSRLLPIGCLILLMATVSTPADVIMPGPISTSGVELDQLDLLFTDDLGAPSLAEPDSTWGQLNLDPQVLQSLTGLSSGFVNMYSPSAGGWVVQNVYVDANDGLGRISTEFDLGLVAPTPLAQHNVRIEYTASPHLSFGPGGEQDHDVFDARYSTQGVGDPGAAVTNVGAPPGASFLSFLAGLTRVEKTQPNVKNRETAHNQCFPMAIANSFQYLEDSFPLEFAVPHNHAMGIKGDNTIVGQLDTKVNRNVPNLPSPPNPANTPDRRRGSGVRTVNMVTAKFDYLNMNGIGNKLHHKHQGGRNDAFGLPPGANFSPPGRAITSYWKGDTPTWDWICGEVKAQEDVEIVWRIGNSNAGHAVRVFECGKTLGIPWLGIVHDRDQSDDTKGLVTERIWATDTDADGLINVHGTNRQITFAFSESVPEPASALIFAIAAVVTAARRNRRALG